MAEGRGAGHTRAVNRPRRAQRGVFAAFLVIGALALSWPIVGCGDSGTRPPEVPSTPSSRPAQRPRASLRLLVLTDLKGYLEPCGCTTRPLGGIDRMAARIAQARQDGVPSALLLAGDTFFDGAHHAGVGAEEAATQERWKAETLVSILGGPMGAAAIGPGEKDFAQGVSELSRIVAGAPFGLLMAGVAIDRGPEASVRAQRAEPGPAVRMLTLGDVKVGVVGVSELAVLPEGLARVQPAEEALTAAVAQAKADGAQVIVALISGTRRFSRRMATAVRGIDLVVQGGVDEQLPSPPARVGDTVLIHASRQGQGLAVVDLIRRGEGAYVDVSDWSREAERARLDARISELEGRITAWEREANVDRANVTTQRARLAEMKAERAALEGSLPTPETGNALWARYEELGPEAASDPAVAAQVDAYDERVNQHNARVFADVRTPTPPEGAPTYVGSERCGSCHTNAFTWWRATPHGHAYETLVTRHKQFNLSCVGCHVTGYNQPGGAAVVQNAGLVDVGCEQCHGPGSLHAARPDAVRPQRRDVPETVCVGCHNPEHSDRFHYGAYRQMLIAPGHGMPASAGAAR